MPRTKGRCNSHACDYTWKTKNWSLVSFVPLRYEFFDHELVWGLPWLPCLLSLQCTHSCDIGIQTRDVTCHRVNSYGWIIPRPMLQHGCNQSTRPQSVRRCNYGSCHYYNPDNPRRQVKGVWRVGQWKPVSLHFIFFEFLNSITFHWLQLRDYHSWHLFFSVQLFVGVAWVGVRLGVTATVARNYQEDTVIRDYVLLRSEFAGCDHVSAKDWAQGQSEFCFRSEEMLIEEPTIHCIMAMLRFCFIVISNMWIQFKVWWWTVRTWSSDCTHNTTGNTLSLSMARMSGYSVLVWTHLTLENTSRCH